MRPHFATFMIAVGTIVAMQSGAAAVKTRADFDKAFDFSQVHTWEWTEKRGYVMAVRTPDDDPAEIQRRAEPIIMEAVSAEMLRRGLKPAAGTPDVTVTYYLLLSLGSNSQTIGQFLPPVTEWGIPPFTASTQSLQVIEQGSLVLDLMAKGENVWRGIAEAQIKTGLPQEKRAALIREAVRDVLNRYPPKK